VPPVTPPSPQGASELAPSLEMAHVLFTDIVAYSKLPMEQQQQLLSEFQEAVRSTAAFARAQRKDRLVCLPTGDGMALVFFGDPESAVHCALELSRALREHPEIKLRMGVHTGPVYRVADINAARNVAGGGINMAQRVMDCGDAGHILVSHAVADVLSQLGTWNRSLHDLGEAEVKHGVRIHIYNLFTDDAGNPALPQKLQAEQRTAAGLRSKAKRKKLSLAMAAVLLAAATAAGGLFYSRQRAQKLTVKDTVVLADFANKTGDPVFDDTLNTALGVALNQSPFLNVLSDDKEAATLQLMARPAGSVLTTEVAHELCLRAGSKAYIAGSIASLGKEYVLWLKAVNCRSGEMLAQEQVRAAAKEQVLDALGEAAAKLRAQLGESMATVEKFDVPLAEATTPSLEALRAYSLGEKAASEKGYAAGLPYMQRAIQLDPSFAMGYRAVGELYGGLFELGRASEYFAKAFELRDRASEREKLNITADYYLNVTGELDKAAQTFQEHIDTYPRDGKGYDELGTVYAEQGRYEKAVEMARRGLSLDPDNVSPYANLGYYLLALQRFDEARQIIGEAQARKLDDYLLHDVLYALAFLGSNSPAMTEQQQWFADQPEYENVGLSLVSDTESYAGHLGKARQLTKLAVDSAVRADSKETGATWQGNAARREAGLGNATEARRTAEAGLKLAPASQGAGVQAALAFAMAGDTARAESMAQDLNKRYPLDTQMQSYWLPAIRAQVALNRKNPAAALDNLQAAAPPIEFGQIAFVNNLSCLCPTYIRGQAYLASGQGRAAAAEFQKILDHSGIVWNCWTGALAHLGVARANSLQAKNSQGADADAARARALAAFKEFLTLWKDADPDIPVLKQAKSEYAKLQ